MSTNDPAPTNKSGPEISLPLLTPARIIAAICVILPFIAVLWVPIYDKATPEAAGFPFFFWWQLLWVAITAALMGLAYFVVRREELAHRSRVAAASSAPSTAATAAPSEAPEENAGTEDEEAGE